MKQEILGSRYLDAFLACYDESDQVSALKELIELFSVIKEDRLAYQVFCSPIIDNDSKLKLLNKVFSNVGKHLLNFTSLLISKKRLSLITDILVIAEDRILDLQNLVSLNLYSSYPLLKEQLDEIDQFGQNYFKKQVKINEFIDESILAGFKIETKNVKFDGTLKNSLRELAVSIKGGR